MGGALAEEDGGPGGPPDEPQPPLDPAGSEGADLDPARLYAAISVEMVRMASLLIDDRETAEDIVQDVFTDVLSRWDRVATADDATGYVRRAVVYRVRSAIRRRRIARGYVPPAEPYWPAADEPLLEREERRLMLEAIPRLPARQREVIVLRYYQGLSIQDTAAVLRISPSAVRTSTAHAIVALRDIVERGRGGTHG